MKAVKVCGLLALGFFAAFWVLVFSLNPIPRSATLIIVFFFLASIILFLVALVLGSIQLIHKLILTSKKHLTKSSIPSSTPASIESLAPAQITTTPLLTEDLPHSIHEENIPKPSISSTDAYLWYGGIDAALANIDLMEGHQFEHWCAELLGELGFRNIEVTPASGDHGVDIIAFKDDIKYAIQCKRYTSDLGNKPIQEVYAGKSIYHCHIGAVITNRFFTTGAIQLAEATGTLLWDRDWIKSQLIIKQKRLASITTVDSPNLCDDTSLLYEAMVFFIDENQVSISGLQRKLRLSYAQSAKIIDKLEDLGYIGPFTGSSPRKILITKEDLFSIRNK